MNGTARNEANLRLLQRVTDRPDLSLIQATATHVVLYEFISNSWTKCPIEGSLFLVGSNSTNNNSLSDLLVILNRNSIENLILEVDTIQNMDHQEPYLILKVSNKIILGIYFHNPNERIAMCTLLAGTMENLKSRPAATATTTVRANSAPAHPAAEEGALQSSGGAPTQTTSADSSAASSSSAMMATLSLKNALGIGGGNGGGPVPENHGTVAPSASAAAPAMPPTAATGAVQNSSQPRQQEQHESVLLDKRALQLTLLSLLQNDQFLDIVHNQYVRVVRTRERQQQQQQSSSPPRPPNR
jgi:mRNA-decapping enzyme 1B